MQTVSRKIDYSDVDCCACCAFWEQFNDISGICSDTDNWDYETIYDSWCDKFKKTEIEILFNEN